MENSSSWIISIPESFKNNEQEDEEMSRDWSDPGIDTLEMVLRRLGPVENLKFGGVCRRWRSLRFTDRDAAPHSPAHFPFLMHPSFTFSHRRHFLSPTDGRCYKFSLSELFAETCLGSSGSWLVMRGRQLHLFNPFTLHKIKLPYIEEDPLEQAFSYKVPLVTLWKPDSPDFAAVLFYPQSFYYLRDGHRRWTCHSLYNAYNDGRIVQAATVEGKFYAMTNRGRLAHIDLDRNPVLLWMDQGGSVEFDKAKEHCYLMEVDAKLVVVIAKCQRYYEGAGVRMLVLDETTFTWSDDTRGLLKNRMLFMGQRGSTSVAAAKGEAKVYTAAGDGSFGMFELGESGGRGRLCCVHHQRSSAVWVTPEPLFRERRQNWWVGLYAVFSERVILCLIGGQVVFELLLLLSPRALLRLLPHFVMGMIEDVLVWGPVWISFCIACNCFFRTLAR